MVNSVGVICEAFLEVVFVAECQLSCFLVIWFGTCFGKEHLQHCLNLSLSDVIIAKRSVQDSQDLAFSHKE